MLYIAHKHLSTHIRKGLYRYQQSSHKLGNNYAFFNDVRMAGGPSSNPSNPGTFGWCGALGTNSFVDPVEKLSLVVMIQNEPPFTTSTLTYGLRNPLYAALD